MTCIYLQSLLFQLVLVFGWKPLPRRVYYEYCYFNLSSAYSVLSSMINFVTPVIIASFPPELQNVLRRNHESCGRILQKLAGEIERLNTRLESSNSPTSKQQPIESMQSQHDAILIRKLQQRNTRAAKTTFLIVPSFVVCWLPHSYLSIMYNDILCRKCAIDIKKHPELGTVFPMLSYLNSAINPILYSFPSSEFKKAAKDFISRRRPSQGVQIQTENTRAMERRAATL